MNDDRVPADLFLLMSTNESVYIKTDQIDGETDLKVRKAFSKTAKYENFNELTKLTNTEI